MEGRQRKTETEMGGLCEERFSDSGRGMENEGEGLRGVETIVLILPNLHLYIYIVERFRL